jgi:formylglycine-generating enzyme required for sulfatase activity
MTKNTWVLGATLVLSGTLACAGARTPVEKPAEGARVALPGGVALELVHVKGGCFQMGSVAGAPGGPEEKPAHEVCVSDFDMGKYEVTQAQWTAVMGTNPSKNQACGGSCPVEMVSWNDAQQFLSRLNEHGDGASRYRLPTEAEWEYAARGGGKPDRYAGRDDDFGRIGWYTGNTLGLAPVGKKEPNAFGLHDMSGNVWEWTNDWYGAAYYAASPRNDPQGPSQGDRRVLRGGSFADSPFDGRVYYRNFLPPDYRSGSKGFRLVRAPRRPPLAAALLGCVSDGREEEAALQWARHGGTTAPPGEDPGMLFSLLLARIPAR